MPVVCHRLISSYLIFLTRYSSLPELQSTANQFSLCAGFRCLCFSAHDVSVKAAYAHHDNNRNVFGEWVFCYQGAMVYQLTRDLSEADVKKAGFDAYYIDHTKGIWPQAAAGIPFTSLEFQSKGDAITDLFENLAAEQKARTVYENLLRVIDDPDVIAPLKFLRAREIVHFQRFGEALEMTKGSLDCKNFYYYNLSFDRKKEHPL